MRVAVVGNGSIGARHARNLRALGCEVVTVDPAVPSDYEDLRSVPNYDAAVIATPASTHLALTSQAFSVGADVFIEKPLAVSIHELKLFVLGRHDLHEHIVQVGYQLRFRPELRDLRERFSSSRPVLVDFVFSQRLDEWRPGRDYRSTPSAVRAEGGGILLEASHELDLALWLFGPWRHGFGMSRRLSDLEIDVEDYAAGIVEFEGLLVRFRLDMIGHGYRRSMEWVYADGQAGRWDYVDDGGAAYLAEMRHFLDCVRGRAVPDVSWQDGADALALAGMLELDAASINTSWVRVPKAVN